MNTTRILLTAIAGLITAGTLAFAGPDTWRRPDSIKPSPRTPASCCAGKSATCPPGGTCCDMKHTGAGCCGKTHTTNVVCNSGCPMPAKERGCCKTGCAH